MTDLNTWSILSGHLVSQNCYDSHVNSTVGGLQNNLAEKDADFVEARLVHQEHVEKLMKKCYAHQKVGVEFQKRSGDLEDKTRSNEAEQNLGKKDAMVDDLKERLEAREIEAAVMIIL